MRRAYPRAGRKRQYRWRIPHLPAGRLPYRLVFHRDCGRAFTGYVAQRSDAKAFAINGKGGCGYGTGRTIAEARENAVTDCRDTACRVYAVGQHMLEN